MSDLERELERELHRVLDPIAGLPVPPRRSAQSRRAARALLGGAGAALSLKLLTGAAVAAAAVTIAGAATTGSLNPADWGQQVSRRVAECKADLANGNLGIGDCVSTFARQHGAAVASQARHHAAGNAKGNGNGSGNAIENGSGNTNALGKDKSHAAAKGQSGTAPTADPDPVDPAVTHPPVHITPGP